MNQIGNMVATSPDDGHAGRVTLPARKRLNHRGPLSIDVFSAWYFITICAEGHAPWVVSRVPRDRDGAVGSRVPRDRNVEQMDFATVADAILSAARWYHGHGKWFLALFLVMPDHLHFIAQFPSTCGHAGRVTLPMVSIIQQFKSYLVRTFGLRFQRDFFDTRLRDDAHFAEEYDYILGNPVRRGLCAASADWPYSIAFTRDGEEIPVGSRVPRDRFNTQSAPCDCAQPVGSRVPRDRDGRCAEETQSVSEGRFGEAEPEGCASIRAVALRPPSVEIMPEERKAI